MLYKIKLNESSPAKEDQIIDGYLSSFNRVGVYEKGDAIKKAKAFFGAIEPIESSKLIDDIAIATYPIEAVRPKVLEALEGRESFQDADKTLGENMYSGEAFFEALDGVIEEMSAGINGVTEEDADQMMELASIFVGYEYVLITKV